MKLFEVLPQNLFSILASKNREIYVEALFVIRKAFKQEMSISKSDLVSMLISNLDDRMLSMDFTDETEDDGASRPYDERGGISLSSTAHFLLRRLRETGWIDMEYQLDSFDENITLPDYSIKIINLLYSITDESVKEYNLYVYSTYSVLKTADLERDEFMYNALLTAYENTIRLVDELKTLHNNIRRYHQTLNEYVTVNDILKGHFDEYKSLIMDRVYHPLKTLDSVPRFKLPILKILGDWLGDQALRERMTEQAMLRGKYKQRDDAAEDIIVKIGDIMDIYERLDDMLQEIDGKNSAYTRASIEKMRYLLNSDRSIKGKIVELLSRVAASHGSRRAEFIDRLGDCVHLFRQEYVDQSSLYARAAKERKKDQKPMEVRPPDTEGGETGLEDFLSRAKRSFSLSRVISFMESVMNGVDAVSSREIPVCGDEEFILIMLASLKGGDKNVFFNVEFMEGYHDNNGYRIPDMLFVRKESKYVARAV